MNVTLAIMAKCHPDTLRRAILSAAHMVDQVCVVVAPGDPLLTFELPIPGKIVVHDWIGFANTRTATYKHAERIGADWVVMIDADDVFAPGSTLPKFEARLDAYETPIDVVGPGWRWRWMRTGHLLRAHINFRWIGTGDSDRHEVLWVPPSSVVDRWNGLVCTDAPNLHPQPAASNGAATRAGGRTYKSDAEAIVAKAKLLKEPRAAFYHAQSLKDAGLHKEAFFAFKYRANNLAAVGWVEETFWAKLWLAKLAPFVGEDPIPLYLDAHFFSPFRAEPLFAIESYYRQNGNHDLAFEYGHRAASCPYPEHARLFVEVHTYSEVALKNAGIQPR